MPIRAASSEALQSESGAAGAAGRDIAGDAVAIPETAFRRLHHATVTGGQTTTLWVGLPEPLADLMIHATPAVHSWLGCPRRASPDPCTARPASSPLVVPHETQQDSQVLSRLLEDVG